MVAQVKPFVAGRWRFAAHLGVSRIDAPLLAAAAGTVDPIDQIACAASLGFAGVTDNSLKMRSPATQRRMAAALREHGLELGTFTHNVLGSEPPFFWGSVIPDVAAALSETLAAAERAGGGCINVVLLDAGTALNEQMERAAENLVRAEAVATAHGIRIAVEAISRERVPLALTESVADLAQLVRTTGSPRLGLILDSCHCHCAGEDMADAVRANADIMAAVQLADMPGRVEPGEGVIGFGAIIAALAGIGWEGLVEAEFNPALPGLPGEMAAVDALRRL